MTSIADEVQAVDRRRLRVEVDDLDAPVRRIVTHAMMTVLSSTTATHVRALDDTRVVVADLLDRLSQVAAGPAHVGIDVRDRTLVTLTVVCPQALAGRHVDDGPALDAVLLRTWSLHVHDGLAVADVTFGPA